MMIAGRRVDGLSLKGDETLRASCGIRWCRSRRIPACSSAAPACRIRAATRNTARVLGEYVRERKIVTLEEAVRKMTSLPQRFFGFTTRGDSRRQRLIWWCFDPARVKDEATYPAPHAFASGIPHVLVNGVFVVRDGKTTGATPGQVLRRN
jgi:N-acyl-D-aspartate/D-glutamate deacylase